MSKKSEDRTIADLKAQYARCLKGKEAGYQTVTANNEIIHILTRMGSLIEADQMNSPEYDQLRQRYEFLKDFSKRQERIFNSLGF